MTQSIHLILLLGNDANSLELGHPEHETALSGWLGEGFLLSPGY